MDDELVKNLARKMVEFENAGRTGVREDVEKLLSPRFVGITRGGRPDTGEQEEDREQLIGTIMSAEPNSPLRVPEFDDQHSGAWAVGDGCWVVKGKVATRNKGAPKVFRNTWIFCSDGGEWRLFSLQVTRLLSTRRASSRSGNMATISAASRRS
jgi:hypothetical protein